jgi:hypothetical protein
LEHDFYIEPVGEWTMMTSLPGWAERLVKVETPGGAIGWCLSPLDVAYNKADAAGRKTLHIWPSCFAAVLYGLPNSRSQWSLLMSRKKPLRW